MPTFHLSLSTDAELAAAVGEIEAHGGLLVPAAGELPPLFDKIALTVARPDGSTVELAAQVVQHLGPGQMAVLVDEADRSKLKAGEPAEPSAAEGPLWARIGKMSKAEKLRLAKHGNAEARRLLLKDPDPALHLQVLNNPGVTTAEVAALIKGGAAGVAFVRAVASRSDLASQGSIMEALVLSPKTPLNIAVKLVNQVSLELVKRIAKTGKGRGAVVAAAKRRVTRR